MPLARIDADATISYGQQLVTLREGATVDGDLAAFVLDPSSGVTCTDVDEPTPRRTRAKA